MNLTRVITDHSLFEGEQYPWGWGVAWRRSDLRAYQLMPIPLNWLAGWLRWAYYGLAHGPRDRLKERIHDSLEVEYSTGYGHGREAGERAAWDQTARIIRHISPEIAERLEPDTHP